MPAPGLAVDDVVDQRGRGEAEVDAQRPRPRQPAARQIGKIITPGENHHADTCTEATAMAIVSTERANATRRFLVMNCLVGCLRRYRTNRGARRRPGGGPLGGGAVTMVRALSSIRAGAG